jgi:hypothetical protein
MYIPFAGQTHQFFGSLDIYGLETLSNNNLQRRKKHLPTQWNQGMVNNGCVSPELQYKNT